MLIMLGVTMGRGSVCGRRERKKNNGRKKEDRSLCRVKRLGTKAVGHVELQMPDI